MFINVCLLDFTHPYYETATNEWNLDNVHHLEGILQCLEDSNQIKMVRKVIRAFDAEVKPLSEDFQRGTANLNMVFL